jgi:hypothetical protein
MEQPAQVHNVGTIEVESGDRCPSRRSNTEDLGEILVPRDVFLPQVLPWMIERREVAASWVGGLGGGVLEVVAALA